MSFLPLLKPYFFSRVGAFIAKHKALLVIVFFVSVGDLIVANHFMASLLKEKGLAMITIGFFFGTKKLVRVLLDIPAGFFAARFGVRSVLIFSRIAKLISVLLLFFNSEASLFLSMVFYGVAHVTFYGKFEVYLFNYFLGFSGGGVTDCGRVAFRRVVSVCYALQDVGAFALALLGVRFLGGSVMAITLVSVCTAISAVAVGLFLPRLAFFAPEGREPPIGFGVLLASAVGRLGNGGIVVAVLLLSSLVGAAFSLPDVLQLGLIDKGGEQGASWAAIVSGAAGFFMFVGSVVSVFLSAWLYALRLITFLYSFAFAAFACCMLWADVGAFGVFLMLSYLLIFPALEVLLESVLDASLPAGERVVFASVVTTVASVLGALLTLLVSLGGAVFGHQLVWALVCVFISAVLFLVGLVGKQ